MNLLPPYNQTITNFPGEDAIPKIKAEIEELTTSTAEKYRIAEESAASPKVNLGSITS